MEKVLKKIVIIGIGSPLDKEGNKLRFFKGSNGLNHFKEWHALSLEGLVKVNGICRRNLGELIKALNYLSSTFTLDNSFVSADSYQSLINDERPDIVSICTPDDSHYEIAKFALEHGAHVVVEKPMTKDRGEAIELADIACTNKRYIQLGTIFRYVREHLLCPLWDNSKKIVFDVEFRGADKDVVFNIMPHALSLMSDEKDFGFTQAYYVRSGKNRVIIEGKICDGADLLFKFTHRQEDFKQKKFSISFDDKVYDLSQSKMINGFYYTVLKEPDKGDIPGNEIYLPNLRRRLFRDLLRKIDSPGYTGPFADENGVLNTMLTCYAKDLLEKAEMREQTLPPVAVRDSLPVEGRQPLMQMSKKTNSLFCREP